MIHNSKTITTTFFSTLDKEQTIDCLKFLFLPWKWKDWKNGKYIKQAEDEIRKYLNETPQSPAGDCGGERVVKRQAEDEIKNYIGAKKVFSFYNGRAALYFALKFAGVKNGDEVIIQAYTCVSVPNAVLETGAKPIYCDIDESLNLDPQELAKKITEKTKAVIVQHTFGNPARIDEIKKMCKNYQLRASIDKVIFQDTCLRKIPSNPPLEKGGDARKIFLIEDCAHSLGAKYNGRLVGTFGDMSMFSFGRDKVVSSVNGGMLCVNNEELLNSELKSIRHSETTCLRRQGNEAKNPVARGVNKGNVVSHVILPPPGARGQDDAYPPYFVIVQNLLYPILTTISLKWYNKLSIGKCIMYAAKKLRLLPLILSEEEKNGYSPSLKEGGRGRLTGNLNCTNENPTSTLTLKGLDMNICMFYLLPNVLAYLFLKQFKKLERYNEHRCEIANFYNNALRGTEFKLPRVWNESEPIYLRYTVLTEDAVGIMRKAREKDIYLGDWYRNVIAPSDVNLEGVGYEQNKCSKAEKYSALTLNLPNHSGIDLDDAKKVIIEIKKLWNFSKLIRD